PLRTLLRFSRPRSRSVLPPFPTRRSSDLHCTTQRGSHFTVHQRRALTRLRQILAQRLEPLLQRELLRSDGGAPAPSAAGRSARLDRKSTRLNSSHVKISYAVFCLKKKK